jgi:hypothetical protein
MHWRFLIVPVGTLRETLRVGNWLRPRSLSRKRLCFSILVFVQSSKKLLFFAFYGFYLIACASMHFAVAYNDFEILLNCVPENIEVLKESFQPFLWPLLSFSTLIQVSKKLISPLEVVWKSFSLVFFAVSSFSSTLKLFVMDICEVGS